MQIKTVGGEVVFKIPKDLIAREYVENFLERIDLEVLLSKSRLKDKDAQRLSEDIKKDWWEKNKGRISDKVKNR